MSKKELCVALVNAPCLYNEEIGCYYQNGIMMDYFNGMKYYEFNQLFEYLEAVVGIDLIKESYKIYGCKGDRYYYFISEKLILNYIDKL